MMSGALNQAVVLLKPERTRAANGEELIDYVRMGMRWASVKANTGQEQDVAGLQRQAAQRYTVTLRYDSLSAQLTTAHRLRLRGNDMMILAISNWLQRDRTLSIEVVAYD